MLTGLQGGLSPLRGPSASRKAGRIIIHSGRIFRPLWTTWPHRGSGSDQCSLHQFPEVAVSRRMRADHLQAANLGGLCGILNEKDVADGRRRIRGIRVVPLVDDL